MDPNATLRLLRDAINRSVIAGMRRDREDETDALLDIREHVENLDRWLKGGGFLPDDWRPAPDEPVTFTRGGTTYVPDADGTLTLHDSDGNTYTRH